MICWWVLATATKKTPKMNIADLMPKFGPPVVAKTVPAQELEIKLRSVFARNNAAVKRKAEG